MTDPGREHAQALGFEQSPDLLVVTAGPDQRIVACNARMRRLLGDRDPVGEPVDAALGGVLGDPVLDLFREVYRTGETHRVDGWQVAAGPDQWISADLTIAPWCDPSGQVAGCIGRGSDASALAAPQEKAQGPYAAAMDLMADLQDALLPADLPVAPALDISAIYLLAADGARAGGDWFDAVIRADGRVALIVGDTVGQGISASAVMGQLRAILHERILSEDPIPEALRSLDRYARRTPESHAATVCVALVDPGTGEIEYCTAGHPAPLVVAADGRGRFLAPSGSGPLTTERGYTTVRDRIGTDEVLLLFTDGLTERPGVPPEQSLVEIARAAGHAVSARGSDPLERRSSLVCERTLEVLTRKAGYADDITLLAAHRTPAFPPYITTIPHNPDAARAVREDLDAWMGSLQVAVLDEFAVLHAAGELITNALEHAHRPDDGPPASIELEARLEPTGELTCSVTDHGHWRDQTPHPDRGRGLGMVSGLVDHLSMDRTPTGTTARFRKRVTRSAQLLTGNASPSASPSMSAVDPVPFATTIDGDVIKVRGPVDLSTADALRASLRRFTRGGTAELTVDLAGVTHLGSAGVQVLHEIRALDGAPLHLRAPTGSVAQHVLDLVRLPYEDPSLTDG